MVVLFTVMSAVTVWFSMLHLQVHSLHYRSAVTVIQYVALTGALFTLQVGSDSRVQCIALLVALQVTGTVGFGVLHFRVHCLHYKSEVTVGFIVLHV